MPNTRIDVSELANALEGGSSPAAIFLTAPISTPANVTQAVNEAIHRDTLLRRAADRAEVDAGLAFQTFLEALLRNLPSADESEFTESDSAELATAGVDLGGPSDPDATVLTVARIVRLIDSSMTTSECAEVVGLTAGRIRQRLAARSVYAFQRGGGEYRFPQWQIIGKEFVPGLDVVVPMIPEGLHPLTVQSLMNTPDVDLVVGGEAMTPIGWLATGGDPQVVARLVAETPRAP